MAVIKKHPKELKQIALSIRNVASALAPRATGNLRNTIRSYNTPDRMITYLPKGSAKFVFSFAPPGATYGKYWNAPYGTGNGPTGKIRKRYPQHFDYAKKAMKDPEVKQRIKDYAKALGVLVASELRESIRKK